MAPESVQGLSTTRDGTPRGARESRLRWAPHHTPSSSPSERRLAQGDSPQCSGSAATLPQMHTEAVRLGAGMRESAFLFQDRAKGLQGGQGIPLEVGTLLTPCSCTREKRLTRGDASHCSGNALMLPHMHTEAITLGTGMRESARLLSAPASHRQASSHRTPPRWKRIALVTDIAWISHLADLFGWMTHGDILETPRPSHERHFG